MKARLTLRLEKQVVDHMKAYAARNGVSVSRLVEDYFSYLTRVNTGKDILSLVDGLPVPSQSFNTNLKKEYHEKKGSL